MEFSCKYGLFWTATTLLPSWRGYLDRSDAFGQASGIAASDGSAELVFAPEGRDTAALTESERKLIDWFLDNEVSVSEAAKTAILQAYPGLQESYGYAGQDKALMMPDIGSEDELKRLIGLQGVNIHQIEKHGIPYIGFEFGCTWDAEHGLGVLMHGTRPVEVGAADTAILLWKAEVDAQSR